MAEKGLGDVLRLLASIPAWALVGVVRVYQFTLSPVLGRHCRFEPSCSAYFIAAVLKYGAVRGTWRGVCRICRCHPWSSGSWMPERSWQ